MIREHGDLVLVDKRYLYMPGVELNLNLYSGELPDRFVLVKRNLDFSEASLDNVNGVLTFYKRGRQVFIFDEQKNMFFAPRDDLLFVFDDVNYVTRRAYATTYNTPALFVVDEVLDVGHQLLKCFGPTWILFARKVAVLPKQLLKT